MTTEELAALAAEVNLRFPISVKDEFVAQMAQNGPSVTFRGEHYDVRFAANLIPEFFFPLDSVEDLVEKVADLLVARGMAPVAESRA